MGLTAGTRFGACEILEPLGEGGMGEVYRARDTELERDVALKVLPESFVSDQSRVARFEQEAKTLASLNHPNIAHIYGLARSDGQTAIVMELVEGPTLADRIEQGPLPADEALNIAMQIADALEAAHDKGIIHRDLKPANVNVRSDGTVKVLDFGIAKALDNRVTAASGTPALTTPAMTEAGIVLGTAAYMSPEQARGRPVDQRADIWAFGVLLYEMLTGQPAFAGEDVSITLARVLERDTNLDALPKGIAPAVRHTIKLCLQKDVRKRIRHIGDVRLGLEGVLETETRAEEISAMARPASRRMTSLALTAIAAIAVTAAVAWSLWPRPEPARISRFDQQLPPGNTYRRNGRSTIAVAPDGSAFVLNTSAGLLLRRMEDIEPRVIPGTEPDLDSPFFSPDGREVAYWDSAGTLFRVAINGGSPPVRIATGVTNPYGASWSPDGTILVGQEQGIFRVPSNGGTLELVIEVGNDEVVYGPRLLPDGDSVLFGLSSVDDPRNGQIVIESLATGDRKALVESANDARYVATGHLIYARGDVLLGVRFDLDTKTVIGSAEPFVPDVKRANANQTGVAQYGVGDDGTLVYLSGQLTAAESSLVWVDRAGREEPLGAPLGSYTYPRISPDGARLVLDDSLGDNGFWIWDFTSEILMTLPLDGKATGFPIWSPDSARIVYAVGTGSGGMESKAANNTGSSMAIVSAPANTLRIPHFFTPSGDGIVFNSPENAGREDLGLATIGDDTEVEWLVSGPSRQLNAELSPDGRWMAYQSNESGLDEIYVRPFPDVESDRVQISNAGGFMPLWSRDGPELFYLEGSTVGGRDRMMVVTFEASDARFSITERKVALDPWLYLGTFAGEGRTYDISADGQRFLAISNAGIAEDTSEIVIVRNWFEELKQLVPVN